MVNGISGQFRIAVDLHFLENARSISTHGLLADEKVYRDLF
jgi:hypothetical protein